MSSCFDSIFYSLNDSIFEDWITSWPATYFMMRLSFLPLYVHCSDKFFSFRLLLFNRSQRRLNHRSMVNILLRRVNFVESLSLMYTRRPPCHTRRPYEFKFNHQLSDHPFNGLLHIDISDPSIVSNNWTLIMFHSIHPPSDSPTQTIHVRVPPQFPIYVTRQLHFPINPVPFLDTAMSSISCGYG